MRGIINVVMMQIFVYILKRKNKKKIDSHLCTVSYTWIWRNEKNNMNINSLAVRELEGFSSMLMEYAENY